MIQSFVNIILGSLLAFVVSAGIVTFLDGRLQKKSSTQVSKILKSLIFVVILLLLVVPFLFSGLFTNSWNSPQVFGLYIRELIVSTGAVGFLWVAWKAISRKSQASQNISGDILASTGETVEGHHNKIKEAILGKALSEWESGKLEDEDVVEEKRQEISFYKMIEQEDITGYYELIEVARYGDGLHPHTHSMIKQELSLIKRGKHKNGENQEHLEDLLALAG